MTRLRLVHDGARPAMAAAAPEVARVTLPGMAYSGRSVLGAVELVLRQGETVALTGPSGAGKTTLMRILAGLETRHDGQVEAPDRLGMVFQEPTLLPWRSLRDNLTIPLGIPASPAEAALAEVGLGGRGADFPRQLSLGQQRRLALARAFAGQPALLLMDEPFVSLDAALADEMMGLFETLRAGRDVTTLLVTHSEAEAQRLATRVLKLVGSPATLGH